LGNHTAGGIYARHGGEVRSKGTSDDAVAAAKVEAVGATAAVVGQNGGVEVKWVDGTEGRVGGVAKVRLAAVYQF